MSNFDCSPYALLVEISTERENKIYKIQSKTEKKYALKTFGSEIDRTKEVEMLMKCASPCVIELFDDIAAGLVIELMETDAYAYFQLIHQSQPQLLNLKVKELLLQTILPGLEFLHKQQICHGDIKCGNILGRQSFPGCLIWKISDFDHATYFDDPIDPGTYLSPEMVLRTRLGKKMPASYAIDVFALGMMIVDIFSGFTYYQEQSSGEGYCDMEVEMELPPSIPNSFLEKLGSMISKDRSKRITISKFAESQVFKDLSTSQKNQIGLENMSQRFDTLTMHLTKDSKKLDKISNQLEDMSEKMDEINQKLDQFLPAIQQNLLDIMATEAVPGKFVMLPVKSSFIRKALSTFYTKYDIWFFCEDESGAHLVKHDHGDEKKKKGFEFFEVTAFGEAAMFVCKCLLMMAIKQLTGMSFFVAGAQVDLTQLRSSLTAVNTEILAYDVETLSKFKMDTASDWDAISRQVMPALKSFLSTKDKSMMGVKPSNDKAGRQKWLCDFHYKSTAVAGVINPPTYNSSNRQNDTAAAPVATATNVPGTSVNNTDLSNNTPDQYRMTKSEADFNQNAGPVQANNSYTPPSYVTHPRTPSAANTAGDKTASYVTGNNKDFNTATIPTFSHLSSIIVPETEAPKVNYHNPYLNADESDHSSVASGVDSKLAYVPFPGNSPQLERGATISAIDHRSPLGSPYSLSNASSPSNGHVLGRSSTIGGFDAHQYYGSHQKTDSSSTAPGQRKGSNASSSGGYGVQPPYQPNYPSTDYQNHQFQNTIYQPPATMGYSQNAPYPQNHQYQTQQQPPPAYGNSSSPYYNTSPGYAPPVQPFYGAPVTLNNSNSGYSAPDQSSDRSTSPLPYNPLLPMTLQRNFNQPK